MNDKIHAAFEHRILTLPVGAILPRKQVASRLKETAKYKRIATSVAEIGVIEPLVVARMGGRGDSYLLLDGHLRLSALKDLAIPEARCLVADDDEAFTYNKRVNKLATVQEHYMIMNALDAGVSEDKLAKTLNVDIAVIKRRRTILDRICPEAIEILKDKSVNPVTFDVLRKMKPLRQIEVAELMCTVANWSSSYAKALLAGTRQEDLAKPERPKKIAGLTPEQMARMEREMESLHQDFKQIEDTYGDDILHLVIASGYLGRLVANTEVERYLLQHHSEILKEFKVIIAATSLDQTQSVAA